MSVGLCPVVAFVGLGGDAAVGHDARLAEAYFDHVEFVAGVDLVVVPHAPVEVGIIGAVGHAEGEVVEKTVHRVGGECRVPFENNSRHSDWCVISD